MIPRQELRDLATDFGLDPNVVEKDYALGWLLAGINHHPEISDQWLFKGGTCLKKCFFETYRFSEDLDFTVLDPAHIDQGFLERVFGEIADWIYEQCGLEFPADTRTFDVYANPRGTPSVQGKVGYRGPLERQRSIPRIRLDLTNDERVVLEADLRDVHHPYSDRPEGGIRILTYCFEELFAEKVRAMAERLRPRDLYDVVHLYRRDDLVANRSLVVSTLAAKCEFKGIEVPTVASLEAHPERAALESDWDAMLRHQLPALPGFSEFWGEMPAAFEWIFGEQIRPVPASIQVHGGGALDESWRAPPMGYSWRQEYGVSAPLELIRFAAANHLCVNLTYRNEQGDVGTRLIEPYSLRRTAEGRLLLHAVRHTDGQARSYRVDRIQDATVSQKSFSPRYRIELTAAGPLAAPQSTTRGATAVVTRQAHPIRALSRLKPASRVQTSPSYVVQCLYCQKKFTRQTYDTRLNEHKTKDGWPCPGRTGHLVEAKY